MKHVLNAFPQAAAETARSMTYELRQSALDHGWHPEIVNNLFVVHTGHEFKVHIPKQHSKSVHDLEYGTESTPPTAVLRKFNNRPHSMESTFLKSLSRITEGKL